MVTSWTPTPMPAMNRHRSTAAALLCVAIMAVQATYHSRDQVNTERRPNLSATEEKRAVPMNRPAKVAAAKLA